MVLILLFSWTTRYMLHWVLNTLEIECHSECIKEQDSKGNGPSRIEYKKTFKDSYFCYFCTLEIPKFRILSGVGTGKIPEDQLQFLHECTRSVLYSKGQDTQNDDYDTGEESREKKQSKRKKIINQKWKKNPKINTTLLSASCSEPRALYIIRE